MTTYLYCKTNSKEELNQFFIWCKQFSDCQIVLDTKLEVSDNWLPGGKLYKMPVETDLWWSLRQDPTMKMINWNTKEEIN